MDTESQIVKAVFPNPPVVMQVFLQRVFAQSVRVCRLTPDYCLFVLQILQHMEQLLHRASEISDLAYLRVLQLVHFQVSILVEDLKSHELPHTTPRTPYEATEFRRALQGSAPLTGTGSSTSISTMLDSAMEELFVPYTEGQRYIERENRSLVSLYGHLLNSFVRYHVRA